MLLVSAGFAVFAEEPEGEPADEPTGFAESYSGIIGVSYNNIFEKECDYLGAVGINFGGYTFFSHKYNIGMFTLTSLNFIVIGGDAYDGAFLYDQTLAPAFRFPFDKKLELLFALGPHLSIFNLTHKEDPAAAVQKISTYKINVGASGDLSLKYNIDRVLYIEIGVNATYDFFTSGGTSMTDGYHKEVTFDYYLVGIKPRVMLGTNARVFSGLL